MLSSSTKKSKSDSTYKHNNDKAMFYGESLKNTDVQ